MSIIQGNAHTSAGGGGFQIERSLRFNSADSAYLNRTAGSPTNQIKWTFSGWIKRSTFGAYSTILSGGSTVNDYSWYGFDNNDKFAILHNIGGVGQSDNNSSSTMVFRDPSAWYHIVIVYDSANATSANRTILYVNGVQQTISAVPSLNEASSVNASGITQYIAQRGYSAIYNNGYMTELNFIDGQALTPSSFGETDSATGVWKPKAYSGTYGTNGFYLKFADNSGTTSTTLGKDSSGNGNNWTPNNFSVTAGVGNDSLVDSPTNYGTDTGVGGEVRGNYCTWNPLYGSTPTLANGNLDATTNNTTAYGTVSVTSGKWYWEILVGNASYIGVMDSTYIKSDGSWSSQAIAYVSNGNKYNGTGSAYGASYTTNDIIGVALDMDAGTIVFYKNGSSQGTAFSSGIAGKELRPMVYSSTSGTQTANFGQRAFAYTAPSGFSCLVTTNLPTPTIGATSTTQANDYFNPVLYTGNGYPTSGTQSISGVGFQPDFVWIKYRSGTGSHSLYDAIRGATKGLFTNLTNAEETDTNSLTSLNSDGFSVGTNSTGLSNVNVNSGTYVAWNWKANGAGSSNTAGTITSTVSANTTSGFSIVTYTGTGANATVGHGLGVAPSMVIVKNRTTGTTDWPVWHTSLGGGTYRLYLDLTSASGTATNLWNSTVPTSTVFSIGTSNYVNGSGDNYVAYLFAPVAGYSAFGSYTGNGSADGPFVYTGFRPRFVMIKRTDSTGEWAMFDAARDPENIVEQYLSAQSSAAEATYANDKVDFVSSGFKIRGTPGVINTNGGTYIYMAFAESPFKYSLAR